MSAPSSFALAFMNMYFLERGSRTGRSELALRFPLPRLLIDGLTIEKLVTLDLSVGAGGSGHPLTIAWKPVGDGPLPSFDGTVSATPQAEDTCGVTIAGSYTPPGGLAGAAFDKLIGIRIANATLAALLAQLKTAIESDNRARTIP